MREEVRRQRVDGYLCRNIQLYGSSPSIMQGATFVALHRSPESFTSLVQHPSPSFEHPLPPHLWVSIDRRRLCRVRGVSSGNRKPRPDHREGSRRKGRQHVVHTEKSELDFNPITHRPQLRGQHTLAASYPASPLEHVWAVYRCRRLSMGRQNTHSRACISIVVATF